MAQFSKQITLLLRSTFLINLLCISGYTLADPVWELADEAEYAEILSLIEAPNNTFAALPIQISSAYLDSLEQNEQIETLLSSVRSIGFRITETLNFPNGDIGWHATDSSNAVLQSISMTAGSVYFTASIISGEESFRVIARKHPEQPLYIGWIYSEIWQSPPPINEPENIGGVGAFSRGRSRFPLKEAAASVTISADLLDNYYTQIDKDLVWTIEIDNPLGAETNPLIIDILGPYADETLNVGSYFVSHSDLIDLPGNCQEHIFLDTNPWKRLGSTRCNIDSIAAYSKATLLIKSRLKPEVEYDDLPYGGLSYPNLQIYDSVTNEFIDYSYSGYFTGPIPVLDVLTDSDNDGIGDFNENLLGSNPADNNSGVHRDVRIDVAVLYTKNFIEDIYIDPDTKINNIFTMVNEIFAESKTGIQFNVVHYEELDYENNCIEDRCTPGQRWNDTQTVISEYGVKGEKQWKFSEKIRSLKGADYIVIIDGDGGDDPTAGQAVSGTNNRGYFGFQKDKRTAFIHYSNWGFGIDEETMAHELGHLLGMSHSRQQAIEIWGEDAGISGTFPWATGHALFDKFGTIMTYPSKFGRAVGIRRFSDASRSDCEYTDPITSEKIYNVYCGVDRSDLENGADAVGAMKITRYQHESFSPSRPALPTASSDGEYYSAKFLAGAIKDIELGFKTTFKPTELITAEGTINIAREHVGKVGVTHVVIDAGPLGAFQLNADGQFVSLDLASLNLIGSIEPRPLKGIENLRVFDELILEPLGVMSADLKIYFAYSVFESELLIYSGSPLSIKIAE